MEISTQGNSSKKLEHRQKEIYGVAQIIAPKEIYITILTI